MVAATPEQLTVKTNPLAADRLGPNALVRWEGKTYEVDRPTSRGWELVETGSAGGGYQPCAAPAR